MQRHRSGGHRAAVRFRAAGIVLLAAHLVFVGWFTLRPLDVPWVSPANLHPFARIESDLALGWPEAALRIGEGLALLAPLGVLLPLASGRLHVSLWGSLLRTVALAALLSLGIELLQTGIPGQVVDVDSLFLNTAGVALAHLLFVPVLRSWLRHRAERDPVPAQEPAQGPTPTISRVGIAP